MFAPDLSDMGNMLLQARAQTTIARACEYSRGECMNESEYMCVCVREYVCVCVSMSVIPGNEHEQSPTELNVL